MQEEGYRYEERETGVSHCMCHPEAEVGVLCGCVVDPVGKRQTADDVESNGVEQQWLCFFHRFLVLALKLIRGGEHPWSLSRAFVEHKYHHKHPHEAEAHEDYQGPVPEDKLLNGSLWVGLTFLAGHSDPAPSSCQAIHCAVFEVYEGNDTK